MSGAESKLIGRPPTVSVYVLDTIRNRILDGKYLPGARLDQRQLAGELGVSLIPVRESLRELEAEGFVRILPHRGAFVVELSLDELEEIYLIRENLEALAAQLAAPNLGGEKLDELGRLLQAMTVATVAGDWESLFALNRNFHFTIYQAAQRPFLLQLITSLWDRSTRYRRVYTALRERQSQALAEHQAIFEACQARDPIAAERAVRLNVRQTTEGLLAKIRSKGELILKGNDDEQEN